MLLDNFVNHTMKVEEEDKRQRRAEQRSRAEVRRESAVAGGVEAGRRAAILSGSNPAIPKGMIRAGQRSRAEVRALEGAREGGSGDRV